MLSLLFSILAACFLLFIIFITWPSNTLYYVLVFLFYLLVLLFEPDPLTLAFSILYLVFFLFITKKGLIA